jgi:hypothetical protein
VGWFHWRIFSDTDLSSPELCGGLAISLVFGTLPGDRMAPMIRQRGQEEVPRSSALGGHYTYCCSVRGFLPADYVDTYLLAINLLHSP